MSSGKFSGTTYGEQISFTQDEAMNIADKNEQAVEERLEYLRKELPQSSPIAIPENASIKDEHKKGYEQVTYRWSKNGYNYESRWHTHTPNAPKYSQKTWVVKRTKPGIPAGPNHRKKEASYLVKDIGWISSDLWENAKKLRAQGKETTESRRILDNGHWKAD